MSIEFFTPKEIPAEPVRVRIEFKEKPTLREPLLSKNWRELPAPRADKLLGILSHIGDVTLEEIREERFVKYLNLK